MIDLTPLEVRKKKGDFRRGMRGYDPQSVDDFLDMVADRLEQLVRDNTALNERVRRSEDQVNDYRERERALTEALVTAQEMREQMRQQIEREAELKRREAEADAESIRAGAEAIREREEESIRRLRARQSQFIQSYRAFLERELSELSVMTESLDLGRATEGSAPRRPRKRPPADARRSTTRELDADAESEADPDPVPMPLPRAVPPIAAATVAGAALADFDEPLTAADLEPDDAFELPTLPPEPPRTSAPAPQAPVQQEEDWEPWEPEPVQQQPHIASFEQPASAEPEIEEFETAEYDAATPEKSFDEMLSAIPGFSTTQSAPPTPPATPASQPVAARPMHLPPMDFDDGVSLDEEAEVLADVRAEFDAVAAEEDFALPEPEAMPDAEEVLDLVDDAADDDEDGWMSTLLEGRGDDRGK